jgi:hypothetical protein
VVDVRTQKVNIALAGSEPRPEKALEFAGGCASPPSPGRCTRLHTGWMWRRRNTRPATPDGALTTLLEVEADQPEWIRFQALAAATVREMLETERRRSTPLRSLAARLGVEPAL